MTRIVGYTKYQEAPYLIFNIPEESLDKVLEVVGVSAHELLESDIYLDDIMVIRLRDILNVWITDIDIEKNDWMLE